MITFPTISYVIPSGGHDGNGGDGHHRMSSLAMMADDDTGIDPQLPILLRTLFEKGQEQEAVTRLAGTGTGSGSGGGANSLSNNNSRSHNANHNPPSKQKTVSIAEAMVSQKLARVLCRAGD